MERERVARYRGAIKIMSATTRRLIRFAGRHRMMDGKDLIVLSAVAGWCDSCGPRPTAEDILPFVRTAELDPTITTQAVDESLRRLSRRRLVRRFGRKSDRWTLGKEA